MYAHAFSECPCDPACEWADECHYVFVEDHTDPNDEGFDCFGSRELHVAYLED